MYNEHVEEVVDCVYDKNAKNKTLTQYPLALVPVLSGMKYIYSLYKKKPLINMAENNHIQCKRLLTVSCSIKTQPAHHAARNLPQHKPSVSSPFLH